MKINLSNFETYDAFVENVITDERYRNRGLVTQCLITPKRLLLEKTAIK